MEIRYLYLKVVTMDEQQTRIASDIDALSYEDRRDFVLCLFEIRAKHTFNPVNFFLRQAIEQLDNLASGQLSQYSSQLVQPKRR